MIHSTGSKTAIESYPCIARLSVRYGDLDADGLLSDNAVGRCIEQGRSFIMIEAMRKAGLDYGANDVGMLIASVKVEMVDHRSPGTEIILASGVSKLGNSSIGLRVAIFSEGICLAVSDNVMVLISRASGRPAPVSADLIGQLAEFACR